MNWINLNLFSVVIAGLMLGGCASTPDEEASAPIQPEPAVINDRQIVGQMTAKVTEMMDSGSVVEMKTLIDKLKKEPKAKLQLSDAGAASVDEAQKAVVVVGGI